MPQTACDQPKCYIYQCYVLAGSHSRKIIAKIGISSDQYQQTEEAKAASEKNVFHKIITWNWGASSGEGWWKIAQI